MSTSIFFFSIITLSSIIFQTSAASYDVLAFGAAPTGLVDSTRAFASAWAAACQSSTKSLIYVPKGRYLLSPIAFTGDNCNNANEIVFRIDGTLIAPIDYNVLGASASWIRFQRVNKVTIVGGALDAKGGSLWDCKADSNSGNCPEGATTLSFSDSSNVKIKSLMSLNSQMFHIVINRCENVLMESVTVLASSDSPNTDGIHVQLSTNVTILNSSIKTGDDCVSIGPGTKNLWIETMACGPGHGISIGSLAKDGEEEGVQNVTVKGVVFMGSTNGLRIKSWARPSTGFVKTVRFINIIMRNVRNPIIIDQHYCPNNVNCPNQESGISINDVLYQRVRGTSATPVAIWFDCSSKNPCSEIILDNINLSYSNKTPKSYCVNVSGRTNGEIRPSDCL
ncbi:unnamed protein product [Rhodiola kirilowii]